jgi:hypothetical protein
MEFTQPILSYNETFLPGHSPQERFEMAGDLALSLEIANQGHVDLELYQHCGLNVTAVQAYLMHEFHPLHPQGRIIP